MTTTGRKPETEADTPGIAPDGRKSAPDRSPWSEGIAVGVATIAVGVFVIMATYGEVFVDALVFLGLLIGLTVWSTRSSSTRLRWVLVAFTTVFIGVNTLYMVADLAHPESPGAFIGSVIVLTAGLCTIGLAVAAARGKQLPVARMGTAAAGVIVVLAGFSIVAAAGVEDDTVQDGDTIVAAEDIEFPEEVVVEAGSEALFVTNEDPVHHDLAVEDQFSPVELPASSDVRIPLDLEPGEYRYFCDITGHEDMQGTLIVR